jgi:protein-tyrosine-phosphatase
MAEGFANCYGSDILRAESYGLAPVPRVPRDGILAMSEKNIDISRHVSRRYDPVAAAKADLVVNMSDYRLPGAPPPRLIEWKIVDPYGKAIEEYRKTRDTLEQQVMSLILALRRETS